MVDKPNKLAVLEVLRSADGGSLSLREIQRHLGERYKERTLRRFLAELVDEGLLQRVGQRRGTQYRLAATNFSEMPGVLAVRRPLSKRQPVSYCSDFLERYIPNQTRYLSLQLSAELKRAGDRSKSNEPAGTYARHIFNHLLIDLSYNSSRLEGNTYSLLDTKHLLLEGEGVEGKMDEERVMILNHKEAIRFLVENPDSLSVSKLLTLHYLLSDGLVEAAYSGALRNFGVRVGGSVYIPLEDPQYYFPLIVEKASQITDEFEQSFFLLIQISYLQAFVDVNKRTARMAANLPLIKHNLVPISFNEVETEDYISAILAIYECLDVEPLLQLYRSSYIRSCLLYAAKADAVGYDRVRVVYRQQRREVVRHVIVDLLYDKDQSAYIERCAITIPEQDRASFIHDVKEDLALIDEVKLAGLSVSLDQLQKWSSRTD
ncbi:MAG: hypothetical protein S4CHLAM81_07360 [Chlamydiales bacterium]|nr:hypothetical protein [Chlamydiales bacterium]MCH9635520.1 hypothetical protein [Chlamydiales bacterium]